MYFYVCNLRDFQGDIFIKARVLSANVALDPVPSWKKLPPTHIGGYGISRFSVKELRTNHGVLPRQVLPLVVSQRLNSR